VVPEAYNTPLEHTLHQSPAAPTAYVPEVQVPRTVAAKPAGVKEPVFVNAPTAVQVADAATCIVDLSGQK